MSDIRIIKEIAEKVLAIDSLKGTQDRYLFDRANRVLRHCGNIAQLSEVKRFKIDNTCLNVAALFRDSGFARFARQDKRAVRMVLADLTDEDLRDFSTQVVQENLNELLNPRQMERVCSIILESGNRKTSLIEAMILSDARSLDDMGATGIFNELRRYLIHGRSVSDAIASWKRKIEYDYWTARLREGFRFESTRELAKHRLEAAQQFMEELALENRAGDLEDMLLEQSLQPDKTGSRANHTEATQHIEDETIPSRIRNRLANPSEKVKG